MYASTPTKLDLATFGTMTGLHPTHMAQVYVASNERARSNCGTALAQYEWQDADAISREEMARAIATAESMIERELGYHLLPSWDVDEWQGITQFWRPELTAWNMNDVRGLPLSVKPRWGQLISGGIRGTTLLQADAPITYSSLYSQEYQETATVLATVPEGTAACEIHAFYPGKNGARTYEIRPIVVSVSGTVATITFARENAVLERFQETLDVREVDGLVDANFLTTVDVYRVYNDPSTMANLLWLVSGCGCSGDSACSACTFETATACLNIRGRKDDGWWTMTPAQWCADEATWDYGCVVNPRRPDAVRLWYYSGYQNPEDLGLACPLTQLDKQMALTISRLALSLMERPPCGCAAGMWERWQRDLAFQGGAEEYSIYNLSPSDLNNPLGTRAGAVYAWKQISSGGVLGTANARVAFPS